MNSQAHTAASMAPRAISFNDTAIRFQINVIARPEDIEQEWRHLEASGVGTVFQRYDWVDAYVRHVLPHEKARPLIILGRLGGNLAFILPLAIKTIGLMRVATWIGGNHSSYNFGLWSHEAVAALTRMGRAEIESLFDPEIIGADFAVLGRMPTSHDGVAQPLAALLSSPSATEGYSFSLAGGFTAVLARRKRSGCRRKVKAKLRKMNEAGALRFETLRDPTRAKAALDFFAKQKALRLAEQGRPNGFAAPGIMEFFNILLERSRDMPEPLLEMAEFSVGGVTRAVAGSAPYGGRMNVYFMTYARDELTSWSPGLLLTHSHVEECCARGMTAYDLGIGREDFKSHWCDIVHDLREVYVSFSPRGTAAVAAIRLGQGAKDVLRRNRALWQRLKSARDYLSRHVLSGDVSQ